MTLKQDVTDGLLYLMKAGEAMQVNITPNLLTVTKAK